ncbi:hypothetical protein B0H15DRAFT_848194 [Mycena belliarum]|uniref:Uncharacterized protein n=1 Tax=Mycena belliarum TaxID=1033014 RepID=A0AAD6XPV5_9AGAR|nr:hypothetical protein B0H15DRAFT_848194 [Mycena belliae]
MSLPSNHRFLLTIDNGDDAPQLVSITVIVLSGGNGVHLDVRSPAPLTSLSRPSSLPLADVTVVPLDAQRDSVLNIGGSDGSLQPPTISSGHWIPPSSIGPSTSLGLDGIYRLTTSHTPANGSHTLNISVGDEQTPAIASAIHHSTLVPLAPAYLGLRETGTTPPPEYFPGTPPPAYSPAIIPPIFYHARSPIYTIPLQAATSAVAPLNYTPLLPSTVHTTNQPALLPSVNSPQPSLAHTRTRTRHTLRAERRRYIPPPLPPSAARSPDTEVGLLSTLFSLGLEMLPLKRRTDAHAGGRYAKRRRL